MLSVLHDEGQRVISDPITMILIFTAIWTRESCAWRFNSRKAFNLISICH